MQSPIVTNKSNVRNQTIDVEPIFEVTIKLDLKHGTSDFTWDLKYKPWISKKCFNKLDEALRVGSHPYNNCFYCGRILSYWTCGLSLIGQCCYLSAKDESRRANAAQVVNNMKSILDDYTEDSAVSVVVNTKCTHKAETCGATCMNCCLIPHDVARYAIIKLQIEHRVNDKDINDDDEKV